MTLALYLLAGFGFSVIGLFLGLMFTVSVRKAWLKNLLVTIISLVFGFGCATITGIVTTEHEKTWNDGYCSCCGEWDLERVTQTKYGTKFYVYECNECGEIFKTTTKFE